MVLKQFLFSTSILIAVASCDREPIVSFDTDKATYQSGDRIALHNTSKYASEGVWIISKGFDEIRAELTSLDYFYDFPNPGIYDVSLTTYSKHKSKSATVTKTIEVTKKPSNIGDCVFYINTFTQSLYIYIDGSYSGVIDGGYNGVPQCSTSGQLTVSLLKGAHTVHVQTTYQSYTYNATINIIPDVCQSVKVSL